MAAHHGRDNTQAACVSIRLQCSSFTPRLFTEYPLCARHWSRSLRYRYKQSRGPALEELMFYWGGHGGCRLLFYTDSVKVMQSQLLRESWGGDFG